jgi:hypothetical protein
MTEGVLHLNEALQERGLAHLEPSPYASGAGDVWIPASLLCVLLRHPRALAPQSDVVWRREGKALTIKDEARLRGKSHAAAAAVDDPFVVGVFDVTGAAHDKRAVCRIKKVFFCSHVC